MSINSALSMAVNSLQVNQLALNVVSNNVSNMNTDGYSKQRVNLGTRFVGTSVGGSAYNQVGSNAGVQISSISRYSNEFLSSYYRQQNSGLSLYSTESEIANHITTLMDELSDGGLSKAFDEFYTAATTLQQTPTDMTARENYVQKANNVAILFNAKSKDLIEYRSTLVGDGTEASLNASQANDYTSKINNLLDDLAGINKRIVSSGTLNSAANNLYDQRDKVLSDLSSYMNIETSVAENGVASVSVDGIDLVKHTEALNKLKLNVGSSDDERVRVSLVDKDGKQTYSNINERISGGSLGAILKMGGNDNDKLTVQGTIDTLNDLAKGFAETLNSIQLKGWNADGTPDGSGEYAMAIGTDANGDKILLSPTEPIFTVPTTGDINASNIKINQALIDNPLGVAAAKIEANDTDFEVYPAGSTTRTLTDTTARLGVGNGKNIINVLNTREKTDNASLNNLSPEDFLMTSVSQIGIQAESIENQATSQKAVCNSVSNQLKSETTVDLNEELTDMIKYQRSYQASARIFNTCSEILQTLVTLGQ